MKGGSGGEGQKFYIGKKLMAIGGKVVRGQDSQRGRGINIKWRHGNRRGDKASNNKESVDSFPTCSKFSDYLEDKDQRGR